MRDLAHDSVDMLSSSYESIYVVIVVYNTECDVSLYTCAPARVPPADCTSGSVGGDIYVLSFCARRGFSVRRLAHRGGQRASDVTRGSSNPATFMYVIRVMHGVTSRSVLVSDWCVMQQLTLDDHLSDFHMCLLDSGSLSIPHINTDSTEYH